MRTSEKTSDINFRNSKKCNKRFIPLISIRSKFTPATLGYSLSLRLYGKRRTVGKAPAWRITNLGFIHSVKYG